MDTFDIVIIDSGVNYSHPGVKSTNEANGRYGFSLKLAPEKGVEIDPDVTDNIGHGTAVYSIIRKLCDNAKILVVKIFDSEMQTEEELLVACLQYLRENIYSRIIHISAGIAACINRKELESLCNSFAENNSIIVCAFDNLGGLSYPAAFNSVIGVELSYNCKKINEYNYLINSPVDIQAFGLTQKVPWLNNEYKSVCSNSFSAPYITGAVYKGLASGICTFAKMKQWLRMNAKKVINLPLIDIPTKPFTIHKAIIFPYNKEVHSILRYEDMLSFKIVDYFDHHFLVKQNAIDFSKYSPLNRTLKNWMDIDWNADFDTLIIGHVDKLSAATNQDILKILLEKCLMHNKNAFCLDPLAQYTKYREEFVGRALKIYSPEIRYSNVVENWRGKLPEIALPILSVMGTSKRQGKFSLQLELRKNFQNRGYIVGQLGTEPTSELFGFDYVFPMGYNSTVRTTGYESISIIRNMLRHIEDRTPDIIITGTQSQTIPIVMNNCQSVPLYNYDFLIGTNPDAVLLVVNVHDEIEYIQKTIGFIDSICEGRVLYIVISPIASDEYWSVLGGRSNLVAKDAALKKKNEISKATNREVFLFDQIDLLCEGIIDYFSEE